MSDAGASPFSSRPEPGDPVTFRWRKWGGAPHWVHETIYLGSDQWGFWLGQRRGWRSARPGAEFQAGADAVTLVPPTGDWAMTVNAAPATVRIYIDIAWDVRFAEGGSGEPAEVTGVDMDLDVVRALDARGVYIDDEDEFAEHRVALGYPADIAESAEDVAARLYKEVLSGEPPFEDRAAAPWFRVLESLAPDAARSDSDAPATPGTDGQPATPGTDGRPAPPPAD